MTTVDFDFMIQQNGRQRAQAERVAARLDVMVMRPHYPVSGLLRISATTTGWNSTSW